jgi:hypothetical protein
METAFINGTVLDAAFVNYTMLDAEAEDEDISSELLADVTKGCAVMAQQIIGSSWWA